MPTISQRQEEIDEEQLRRETIAEQNRVFKRPHGGIASVIGYGRKKRIGSVKRRKRKRKKNDCRRLSISRDNLVGRGG